MAAQAQEEGPARLWLHGTDQDGAVVLSVLRDHLEDQPAPPDCLLTGPQAEGLPGPPGDARATRSYIQRNRPVALVLAGAAQPPRAMIEAARAAGLGLFLVDADPPHAAGSLRRRLWRGGDILSCFTEIHCRTQAVADALAVRLGSGTTLRVSGALARFSAARPCNRAELQALSAALARRPVWLALAVPASEAEAVMLAHAQALRQAHRLLLIAIPAQPDDAAALMRHALDVGLLAGRRSEDADIDETTQVYVADTGDDQGLFLRLAQVCYLGGTLKPDAAGADPGAALALGAAPVHGPCGDPALQAWLQTLSGAGASLRVPSDPASADALADAVATLLQPETAAHVVLRGWEMVTQGNDATDRVARAILTWLRERGQGAASQQTAPPSGGAA